MGVDILFLTKNRLEFAREALSSFRDNTDQKLVDRVIIYDDESTDGTQEFIQSWKYAYGKDKVSIRTLASGSPVAVMNHFLKTPGSEFFVKIDSDVIVPPNWLGSCLDVSYNFDVDLLGIESIYSRTNSPYRISTGNTIVEKTSELTPGPLHPAWC